MRGRPWRLSFLAVSAVVVAGMWAAPAQATHNQDQHSPQAKALANIPRSSDFRWNDPARGRAFQSDLAFEGHLAIAGNYNGLRVIDIADPARPKVLRDVWCPGPQNDVSIWGDVIVASVDDVLTSPACGSLRAVPQTDPNGWEGLRLFSLKQVLAAQPDADGFTRVQPVGSVFTKCGSHTHTGIPDGDRVIVYVSSYSLRSGPRCGPENAATYGYDPYHRQISVVEVPLANPAAARVIGEPKVQMPLFTDLVPFGFNPLGGCHDIQVFPAKHLAAAACASVGQLWDISDPAHPDTEHPLWVVDEPHVQFYHSAAFTWDANIVIFGDEVVFESNCSGPQGQVWFHRATNGATLGSFQIPRVQPVEQYCSAHMFNVLKTDPDQYRLVAAWYSGGVTVVDFTQPSQAREVAYYDFAPLEAADTEGLWSAYGYNGFVYSNGLFRGFDSLFIPQARAGAKHLSTLNPQTQL